MVHCTARQQQHQLPLIWHVNVVYRARVYKWIANDRPYVGLNESVCGLVAPCAQKNGLMY